jgi:RNA polymerase primary sigma factor
MTHPEATQMPYNAGSIEDIPVENFLKLYATEAARTPYLSAQEEIDLAKRIENGRKARVRLAKRKQVPPEELLLFKQTITDGMDAMDHLIEANTRLVMDIAQHYAGKKPMLDLIQDGNVGLIRAAKKFDHRRGNRFSTHATWWITQAITRGIADDGKTIRVPEGVLVLIDTILKKKDLLTQKLLKDPSNKELADELNMKPAKLEELLEVAYRRQLSFDSTRDILEHTSIEKTMVTLEKTKPDIIEKRALGDKLFQLMLLLPKKERTILYMRTIEERTQEEVAALFGVSRVRISQLEHRALNTLRNEYYAKLLLADFADMQLPFSAYK